MKGKAQYLPALDGLRAISILWVLLAHLGVRTIPGGFGVTVFFFISGFLITNLLLVENEKNKTINLKNFFIRRVLRLYPPLLVMIFIRLVILPVSNKFSSGELWAALFYFENYFYIHNYYLIDADIIQTKFRIIWSLSIEEHFYLFFPFLFSLLISRKNWLVSVMGVIIIAALFHRIWISVFEGLTPYAANFTYSATTCRADSIMFGCLSSFLLFFRGRTVYLKTTNLIPVFFIGMGLILFSLTYKSDFFKQAFQYSLQGIALFMIVPAILYSKRFSFLNKILSSKPFVFVGKLSYSLYLFHLIAFELVKSYIVTIDVNPVFYCAASLSTALALAFLSYSFVEKPVMALRYKFGSQKLPA